MHGQEPHQFETELLPPYALILVCVIPDVKDLEIARLLGWYRIPLRYAPKVVQVDYLAFYEPASLHSAAQAGINCYADIRGMELAKRRDILKDEPNHPCADEEYYKIQIGPLQYLQNPIRTEKWKRITFLYTTGELFSNATIINDLVVKTEERKILWHSLREKALSSQAYHQNYLPEFDLDPELLMMLGDLEHQNKNSDWLQKV